MEELISKYFIAIEREDIVEVRKIIGQEPSIVKQKSLYGSHYRNGLYAAIVRENYNIAKLLIDSGCILQGYSDRSDLYSAARSGNYDLFDLILKYSQNPFNSDNIKENKLSLTSSGCGCGAIKHSGCKKYIFEQKTKNPILIPAVLGGNILIVQKLLSIGADINADDLQGHTPLIVACNENNYMMVKFLVENGANVNYQNEYDESKCYSGPLRLFPLYAAVKHNNCDIVKYLLSKNADTTLKVRTTYRTETIFNIADEDMYMIIRNYNKNFVDKDENLLNLLIYNGDYNAIKQLSIKELEKYMEFANNIYPCSAFNKLSPLLMAIRQDEILIVEYLCTTLLIKPTEDTFKYAITKKRNNIFQYLFTNLKHGIDPSKNLLYAAIGINNFNLIKFMIEHGADPNENKRNCNAVTDYETMRYLLNNDMDPNIQTTYSGEPVLFEYNFRHDFIKILIDYGLNIYNVNKKGHSVIDYFVEWALFDENKLQIIILLLQYDICFSLDNLKKKLEKAKKRYENYKYPLPQSPYDESNTKSAQACNLYIPIIQNIISGKDECCICMDNYANYTIPSCNHKVVCSKCFPKIKACPQCCLNFPVYN